MPKKAAPRKQAPPVKKAASSSAPAKRSATKGAATPAAKKAAASKAGRAASPAPATKKQAPRAKKTASKATPAKARAATAAPAAKKITRPPVLDKFGVEQRALLDAERATYVQQAESLKAEADQLAQEMEPGDIQFDEESGEGGTMAVDRERDLALSAQARAAVDEIDHALLKIASGTYGACENCGQPIPRARLKALPYARLCVACKSGGLSRR